MSWLTEIAGKAEDLLNKVDQTAATALQNKSKAPLYKAQEQYSKSSDVMYGPTFSSSSASTSPQIKVSKFSRPSENKNSFNPGMSTPRKKPESDDEKLLRFLNSNESLVSDEHSVEKQVKNVSQRKDFVPLTTEVNTNIKESKQFYVLFNVIFYFIYIFILYTVKFISRVSISLTFQHNFQLDKKVRGK